MWETSGVSVHFFRVPRWPAPGWVAQVPYVGQMSGAQNRTMLDLKYVVEPPCAHPHRCRSQRFWRGNIGHLSPEGRVG